MPHIDRAEHAADHSTHAVEDKVPHGVVERCEQRGALGALREKYICQVFEYLPESSHTERQQDDHDSGDELSSRKLAREVQDVNRKKAEHADEN